MRWEFRVRPLAILLAAVLLTGTPLLISLAGGKPLRERFDILERLISNHTFRVASGFIILTLVALEILYSLRKRSRISLPGSRNQWRAVHIVVGTAMVPLVVLHTGGKWGENLNGYLLASLVLTILVGLGGKLAEAFHLRHFVQAPAGAGGATVPHRPALRHSSWLRLHTFLVTVLLIFVAFHVFSVYYF